MQFTTLEYILFLPLVSLCFFLLRPAHRAVFLLLASYALYIYWQPYSILVLLATTLLDFYVGKKIASSSDKPTRKLWLWTSIIGNLSLLVVFKYANQLFTEINGYAAQAGSDFSIEFDIIFPLGISFYTFQSLSYTIDVFLNRRKSEDSLLYFSLYVAFFPQLVAGPVERSTTLLPQLHARQRFSLTRTVEGAKLIIWGFFKKLILADSLNVYVENVFTNPEGYNPVALLLMSLGFSFQLYLDFSAYTDIAIGSARIFGYDLISNFERPYLARSIPEFWRRWHISLTSWLFDYLYKPLGKNLRLRFEFNIILFFVIVGFWHQAGLGFFIFGVLHGLYFIGYSIAEKWTVGMRPNILVKIGQVMLVYVLVTIALVFVRVDFVNDALYVFSEIGRLATGGPYSFPNIDFAPVHMFTLITGIPIFLLVQNQSGYNSKKPLDGIKNKVLRWLVYLIVITYLLYFSDNAGVSFLYFRF